MPVSLGIVNIQEDQVDRVGLKKSESGNSVAKRASNFELLDLGNVRFENLNGQWLARLQ